MYLNRQTRNHLIFLNAMLKKADQIIEEMAKHNGDKLMIKFLRTGKTWTAKGMAVILKKVTPEIYKQVDRESYLLDVALIHRHNSELHYKKFVKEDADLRRKADEEVGGDHSKTLAEGILTMACRGCNGDRRQSKRGCDYYTAMVGLSIEPWEENHPKCPYANAGVLVLEESAS